MESFIKQNNSSFKDQLFCEALGLEELKKRALIVKIPKVELVSETQLKVEKIRVAAFTEEGFSKLGKGLAQIHQARASKFGLSSDNYIGLNPQPNEEMDDWGEFFWKNRLKFQAQIIKEPYLRERMLCLLDERKTAVMDFLNAHSPVPSPVHGDLWSGNALYDGKNPWLIDPAFYFGDREVDIAMTKMFGGFGRAFYQSYQAEFPLPGGYAKRTILYNLYHYLNHFNLFGSAYRTGIETGIDLIERL